MEKTEKDIREEMQDVDNQIQGYKDEIHNIQEVINILENDKLRLGMELWKLANLDH